MKTFITFLVSVMMALTTLAPVAASAGVILSPDRPVYDLKAPFNDYFIGIHRPDGSCVTVEVYAPTYDDAINTVKRERCDFCALDDKTPYFTSGSDDVISQVNRTCPVR